MENGKRILRLFSCVVPPWRGKIRVNLNVLASDGGVKTQVEIMIY